MKMRACFVLAFIINEFTLFNKDFVRATLKVITK